MRGVGSVQRAVVRAPPCNARRATTASRRAGMRSGVVQQAATPQNATRRARGSANMMPPAQLAVRHAFSGAQNASSSTVRPQRS